jgi:hypothetical protein
VVSGFFGIRASLNECAQKYLEFCKQYYHRRNKKNRSITNKVGSCWGIFEWNRESKLGGERIAIRSSIGCLVKKLEGKGVEKVADVLSRIDPGDVSFVLIAFCF